MDLKQRVIRASFKTIRIVTPLKLRLIVRNMLGQSSYGNKKLEKLAERKFFSQSTVTYKVFGYELRMPEHHHIQSILEREPLRENLLAQAAKVLFKEANSEFIDVGANIGDTAAVVYSEAEVAPTSILIEPSTYFYEFLQENQKLFPNSTILKKFVAQEFPLRQLSGSLHHWGGTAKFIENGSEYVGDQIDLNDLISNNTKLVKIDCDGLDFKILKSVVPRIEKRQPAFYYENEITTRQQLEDALDVSEHFKAAGYVHAIVARNCGTLIYAGKLDDHFVDVLNLQFALHAQGLRSSIYYTDVIVFSANHQKEFSETLEGVRRSQKEIISAERNM